MNERPEKKIEYIDVKKLRFDPQNPRMPQYLTPSNDFVYTDEYENKIIDWMLRRGNIIELMGSIGENGYFEGEPMFVVGDRDSISYIVIEGNRRLAAVKLLLNPQLATRQINAVQNASQDADYRPDKVLCLTYQSRSDLLAFLGYRHITGIKQWGSLQKAKYLENLHANNPHLNYTELARLIGSRADYVARLLTALALYKRIDAADYFGIDELNEESINFSFLPTALSYSNIVKYLELESDKNPNLVGLNMHKLKWLAEIMFEKVDGKNTILGESRNLKHLNTIVANDHALSALSTGLTIQQALLRTDEPEKLFRISIQESRNHLESAWSRTPYVSNFDVTDLNLIQEVRKLSASIFKFVSEKINLD